MKQRKPLGRNTPLLAKTGLSRGSQPLTRGPVKPRKQPAKTPEEIYARDKVSVRSGGMCEAQITGVCQGQACEFQHRKAKGQLGAWTPSNGLAVCGHGNVDGCHGYIHQHPTEAHKNGWSVRSGGDPMKQEVLYRGRWVLLDNQGGAHATSKPEPKEEAA